MLPLHGVGMYNDRSAHLWSSAITHAPKECELSRSRQIRKILLVSYVELI